jgi:hypothetical protein
MEQISNIPEQPPSVADIYLAQPSGVIDQDTALAIRYALDLEDDPVDRVFGASKEAYRKRSTFATVRPGHNFTIPLGDDPYADEATKFLFINKVRRLHKRKSDLLKCQMTVFHIDENGEEVIEQSWRQNLRKGKTVVAFNKEVEEHVEQSKAKRNAMVAGLVVTIAGVVVVAEEAHRRHKKQKS